MDTDFCATALEEAIAHHGRPDIFNTYQGSQFTSFALRPHRKTLRSVSHGLTRPLDENVFLSAFETGRTPKEVYATREMPEQLAA